MDKGAHTSSPWRAGSGIASGSVYAPSELGAGYERMIASGLSEADARLVSLSPEMFEWLVAFVDQARVGDGFSPVARSKRVNVPAALFQSAQALIAKATGS